MGKEILIRSKNKFWGSFIIVMLGLLGGSGLAAFLIYISFASVYLDFILFLAGVLVFLFAILCGVALLFYFTTMIIDEEKLEVRTWYGRLQKTIYLDDIHSWIERERKSKYSKWMELTIYSARDKYSLSENRYGNYYELKSRLISGKERDTEKEIALARRQDRVACLILGLAGVFFLFLGLRLQGHKEVLPGRLHTLTSVLYQDPQILKGSKGSRSIDLELTAYLNFTFLISGQTYKASYAADFVKDTRAGDTVFVDIDASVYRKKISGEEPMSFFDKTINYRYIEVYGLRTRRAAYLTLEDYNRKNRKKTGTTIVFVIMGLFFIGFGLVLVKIKDKRKPEKTIA